MKLRKGENQLNDKQEWEEEIAQISPSPTVSPSLTESESVGLSAAKIPKEPEGGQGFLSSCLT